MALTWMLMIELPGRPQGRHMDVMKEDMHRVGVTEEDARDRVRCRKRRKKKEIWMRGWIQSCS